MTRSELSKWLKEAVAALHRVDPAIRAIVLFGSAVYAPKWAQDLDLLVITERKRKRERYLDAVGDLPIWVDVIVQSVGKPLMAQVTTGVKAFGRLVWGDVEAVREVLPTMPVSTLDEARHRIEEAELLFRTATPEFSGVYRDAFNALFDAARMAAMAFLNTEETRWGELRRQLPPHLGRRFRRIIDRLHFAYFYHGQLPPDIDRVFRRWRNIVERFINDLKRSVGTR